MNRPLTGDELAVLEKDFPVVETPPPKLTKNEKLNLLADLVQNAGHRIYLFDRIENYGPDHWARCYHPHSVFGIAIRCETFQKDGLKPDIPAGFNGPDLSVLGGMTYFELERDDLHALSCNCGGDISRGDMAGRLRTLAGGGGPIRQFIRGVMGG